MFFIVIVLKIIFWDFLNLEMSPLWWNRKSIYQNLCSAIYIYFCMHPTCTIIIHGWLEKYHNFLYVNVFYRELSFRC